MKKNLENQGNFERILEQIQNENFSEEIEIWKCPPNDKFYFDFHEQDVPICPHNHKRRRIIPVEKERRIIKSEK